MKNNKNDSLCEQIGCDHIFPFICILLGALIVLFFLIKLTDISGDMDYKDTSIKEGYQEQISDLQIQIEVLNSKIEALEKNR
ncbi:MAG: hypothetical protein HY453_00650 [Parcubacteria group bacterium]|nr:hypothetical protein [Parcubacteria group bacterium]